MILLILFSRSILTTRHGPLTVAITSKFIRYFITV